MSEINVKVKLNENGWKIYKEHNGFWVTNVDDEGYSLFSYDYFEKLFFPLAYKDFADDVISDIPKLKLGILRLKGCPHCGSKEPVIPLDDESPMGMSALNDGYDFKCSNCHKLI